MRGGAHVTWAAWRDPSDQVIAIRKSRQIQLRYTKKIITRLIGPTQCQHSVAGIGNQGGRKVISTFGREGSFATPPWQDFAAWPGHYGLHYPRPMTTPSEPKGSGVPALGVPVASDRSKPYFRALWELRVQYRAYNIGEIR